MSKYRPSSRHEKACKVIHLLVDQPSTTKFYGCVFSFSKDFFETSLVMIESLRGDIVDPSNVNDNITRAQFNRISGPD